MRIEICVALLTSTALHAGLLVIAPAAVVSRDAAGTFSATRPVLTARLMHALPPDESTPLERVNTVRATRLVAVRPLMPGGAVPTADILNEEPRVDSPLRFYPPEAVARGIEGEAILMLRIGADGALIDAQIAKSSGYALLDEAALRAIRATPRFAAGPGEMLFPVQFALH